MNIANSGGLIAIIAIVVATSLVAAGLYVLWPKPPPEENNELFSTPTITLNDTVSSFDTFRGVTTYQDAGTTATHFEAGTNYWFDIKSVPTDKAREVMKINESGFSGWIWCIEVQSANSSTPNLNMWYYTYYIKYGGYVDVAWNTSSASKAVGLAGIAPNRDVTMGIPLWMHADEFKMAETHGWLNFSKPGDYTIKAYLVEANESWIVPSTTAVSLNQILSKASPTGNVTIQEASNVAECQYFNTPSVALYQTDPYYYNTPGTPDGYIGNGAEATDLRTGVPYALSTYSTPTDCARQFLNTSYHDGLPHTSGWIWVIEIDKPGIKASDIGVYKIGSDAMLYFGKLEWNTSQSGRLVGLGFMEPLRSPSSQTLVYYPFDWYTSAGTSYYIVFNASGNYSIKAYLISLDDVKTASINPEYGGVPYLNTFNMSSPIGEREVGVGEVYNSNLFTAPTMTFNESIAQYSSFYSKTLYEDDYIEATRFTIGTPYWFEFRSTIVGTGAGKALEPSGQNPTGWVWSIVVEKADIKASDVYVEFRMDNKFPDMRTTIEWNDSEPGKLVGLVNLAPDRFFSEAPATEWADNFYGEVVAHGIIQFNQSGPYLISTYLVPLSSVQGYNPAGGAPAFADDQIASPVSKQTVWA